MKTKIFAPLVLAIIWAILVTISFMSCSDEREPKPIKLKGKTAVLIYPVREYDELQYCMNNMTGNYPLKITEYMFRYNVDLPSGHKINICYDTRMRMCERYPEFCKL
jgi:hypothetical protein